MMLCRAKKDSKRCREQNRVVLDRKGWMPADVARRCDNTKQQTIRQDSKAARLTSPG